MREIFNDVNGMSYARVDFNCTNCGKVYKQDHFFKNVNDMNFAIHITCSICNNKTTFKLKEGQSLN